MIILKLTLLLQIFTEEEIEEEPVPAIAASGRNVYVVWTDDSPGNTETLFVISKDRGTTFGDMINLSNNAAFSEAPAIACEVR